MDSARSFSILASSCLMMCSASWISAVLLATLSMAMFWRESMVSRETPGMSPTSFSTLRGTETSMNRRGLSRLFVIASRTLP